MREDQQNISDEPPVTGYLMIIRGTEWDKNITGDELERLAERTAEWFNGLLAARKVNGGSALGLRGRVISGKARTVTDGPYAESKEVIGGYLLLDVATMEEAEEIARSSPGLDRGITIEVRPAMNECPVFKRARARMNLAAVGG